MGRGVYDSKSCNFAEVVKKRLIPPGGGNLFAI